MTGCSHGVATARSLTCPNSHTSRVIRNAPRVGGQDKCGDASHLVQVAEDPVGVVGEPLGAVFEGLVGLAGGGGAEDVAGAQFPVPAPQPVQAVFLLVELGEGELAGGDLPVDLGVELSAVGQE